MQIPVNQEQTLVMEVLVLGAGVNAQRPDIVFDSIMPVAPSRLYNERYTPVTVTYRFYWYDAKGFEMHPLEAPRTIVILTNVGMTVYLRQLPFFGRPQGTSLSVFIRGEV